MEVTRTLKIDGMSCDNCVRHVTRALQSLDGVRLENVKIGTASATWDTDAVSDVDVIAALEEAGYDARIAHD